MNTIVYFIRHSKSLKVKTLNYNEHVQLQNEKAVLSVEGEKRAKLISELDELKNIDLVVSSNYVRAVATAKYIADKNNLDIYIDEAFRERKQGITSWNELPLGFEYKQLYDENYKIGDGESQVEVRKRTTNAFNNILDNNIGKRIAIVFHGTAMICLLRNWCDINLIGVSTDFKINIKFNNLEIFNDKMNTPEIFKLEFNDRKELISIKNIKYNMI